jgi:hypothetical protein
MITGDLARSAHRPAPRWPPPAAEATIRHARASGDQTLKTG